MIDYKELLQVVRKKRLLKLKEITDEIGISYNTFMSWKRGDKIHDLNRFRIERYLEEQANISKP